ncbi:hypothetical protein FRC11_004022, partial [Ceratobasidium sp. 423]
MPPITGQSDYTVLELRGANGDILMHCSLRPSQGFIALNARPADPHGWDYSKEIRIPFHEHFAE